MGVCAENTAKKFNISRAEQDEYAIESYKRSAQAYANGNIKEELIEIKLTPKKGMIHFHL